MFGVETVSNLDLTVKAGGALVLLLIEGAWCGWRSPNNLAFLKSPVTLAFHDIEECDVELAADHVCQTAAPGQHQSNLLPRGDGNTVSSIYSDHKDNSSLNDKFANALSGLNDEEAIDNWNRLSKVVDLDSCNRTLTVFNF